MLTDEDVERIEAACAAIEDEQAQHTRPTLQSYMSRDVRALLKERRAMLTEYERLTHDYDNAAALLKAIQETDQGKELEQVSAALMRTHKLLSRVTAERDGMLKHAQQATNDSIAAGKRAERAQEWLTAREAELAETRERLARYQDDHLRLLELVEGLAWLWVHDSFGGSVPRISLYAPEGVDVDVEGLRNNARTLVKELGGRVDP